MSLVQNLVSQLGIDESQAKGGLGLILNMAKEKLGGEEFSQITSLFNDSPDLNNAEDLMEAAPSTETAANGGGLGGALGGITSALGVGGGALGSLGGLMSGFKSLNMDSGILSKFIPVVTGFLESKGGNFAEIVKKFT